MNAHDQPCLVIDGSAREGVRVGVLADGRWVAESTVADGALEATTDLAAEVLKKAHLKFTDIKSYAVCIGPGSMLGIRVSAMAVRTWATLYQRPIYVWESLNLLAEYALEQGIKPPFAVINESRLKRWNFLVVKSPDTFECTKELELDEVNAMALPLVINHTVNPFSEAKVLDDVWSHLPKLFQKKNSLKLESKPDALNPAADYALWSGERHRRTP